MLNVNADAKVLDVYRYVLRPSLPIQASLNISLCIPSPPPDLDCAENRPPNLIVVGTDPHGFDGDGDGVGCET
jgi:hypothetical protein